MLPDVSLEHLFAAASKLCDALVQVAKRMEQSFLTPEKKDLRLLPQLAMSIHSELKNVNGDPRTTEEISNAIALATNDIGARAAGE